MKIWQLTQSVTFAVLLSGVIAFSGCATSGKSSRPVPGNFPSKYKTDRGGNLYIGPNVVENGGLRFKPDHLDTCWIANGFDFNGYDLLYIAPTLSTAKIRDNESWSHELLLGRIPQQLALSLAKKGIFGRVVTNEADIKPGERVLKLQNTVLEYQKGSETPWFLRGLYGTRQGKFRRQPMFRLHGEATSGEKATFEFEGRRSGVSAEAWFGLRGDSDEDIQFEDLQSLTLDLTDFIAAVAGKYKLR